MGTSGPGATNLVTGIATAQLDSVPMVAITGNVPGALIGKDAFQEIDITGITLPMTKHNYLVRNADDIPRVIAEAFYIASHGRPGPSTSTSPRTPCSRRRAPSTPRSRTSSPACRASAPPSRATPSSSRLAAKEIAQAKRPLILAGHGVLIAEAWDELQAFAEKTQIPVAWTLLGIGAMDEEHPLAYGYMGMHGWKHVNRAIQSADLLIAIGMRFDDRVTGSVRTYAPYARIIHADIDPAEIGKNVAVEVPIVGDAKNVLAVPRLVHREARTAPVPRPSSPSGAASPRELAGTARRSWRDRVRGTRPWHGSGGWPERRGSRRTSWSSGSASSPTTSRPTSPTWARTRCGSPATRGSAGRTATSARAAWARWASRSRPRWAPRSATRPPRRGRSAATAASR